WRDTKKIKNERSIMRTRKIHIWLMGLVVVFSAVVAFGQLLICQRCGHENDGGAIVCVHCSTRFPGVDQPEPRPAAAVEERQDGYIAGQWVADELAEGRKYEQNQAYELARLFFLNALALEGVTHPAGHESRTGQLLQLVQVAEAAARSVRKTCPRCAGSGQQQVHFEGLGASNRGSSGDFGRAVSGAGASQTACKRCEGVGTVVAVATIDDMKLVRGRAASAYRQYQQARRYAPLGGAWIPPGLVDTLTVRQKATIMRSVVLACNACGGYGRSDCKSCGGQGRIECKDCDHGRVPFERGDSRVHRIGAEVTKACDACHGTGTLPCKTCAEAGTSVCRSCNGTGEARDCRTCSTRGYVLCRRCRGTQLYRGEACPACKGEGYTLCASCGGSARRN
ncbi:MAG: hypothetical protein ACNA71_08775, partial [Kiritimatiellia bacterium]